MHIDAVVIIVTINLLLGGLKIHIEAAVSNVTWL